MSTKSLGTLTLDLVAKTGSFVEGMGKAQRSTKNWRKHVERDLKKVGTAFAAMGVATAGTLAALTKQGMDFVDSQAKTAARLGSTIDDLRAVQIAASDFGIEQGKLESSLASYTKRLGDAARGTGEAQKAYEALGLEAQELINLPLTEQLALISERMAQLDSAAERTSIADRLMSGGRGMVNLFEEGGGAILAARQEVDEFGLSLSALDVKKVEATNDALGRIPRILEPIKSQLAISFAEPLKGITDMILEAGRETGGFKEEIDSLVDSAVTGFSYVVDAVDGVKLVVQLAGRFAALMAIDFQRDMAQLAETIYSGPIDAINALIRQINRIPGIDLGGVEQFGFVKDLQAEVAKFERAGQYARDDIKAILNEQLLGDRIREAVDSARVGAPTLGGAINDDALAAAQAVADASNRAAESSTEASDAVDENARQTDRASRALGDFSRSAVNGANAINRAASGWSGKGAYGEVAPSSVQERIDSRRDLSAYWLEANPNAHATWQVPGGSSSMNAAASRVNNSDNGSKRNIGTLTLKSDNGELDVEANGDALSKWLSNTLSGTAAAT